MTYVESAYSDRMFGYCLFSKNTALTHISSSLHILNASIISIAVAIVSPIIIIL